MPRSREWIVALAALAAVPVDKFLVQPLLFRVEPVALGLAAGMAGLVLAFAGPAAAYWWWTRPLRRARVPFALSPSGRAFVAPESPVFRGLLTIMIMTHAGNLIPVERVPDTDRMRLSTLPGAVPVLIGLAAVLVVIALLVLVLPGPSVTLSPDGVTLRTGLHRRHLPWTGLPPGGPVRLTRWALTLTPTRRTPGGLPRRATVNLLAYAIDPLLLATAVHHYTVNPEHRAAIGTRSELDRLESAYATYRTAQTATA
ncbi:hypothetical protein ACFFX1_19365 [Dactylosporangium sucinum]|nr:hypothetical protein [Dactylosporangium sucinum]